MSEALTVGTDARTAGRLALIWAGCVGAVAVLFVCYMAGVFSQAGSKPPALDFAAFWSAGRLALSGHPLQAYDNAAIEAFERTHLQLPGPGYLAFYYPPPFLLFCLPFALLPYLGGLAGFVLMQAALLWTALRRIAPAIGWPLIAASPGFLMNALSGQNGGFTAACFAGAMLLLERSPWAAGMCLGALVCKPQMAIGVPIALLAGRRWQAAMGTGAFALFLIIVSAWAPGLAAWRGFLANAGAAHGDLDNLPVKWMMIQSAYAGLRLAGSPVWLAYVGQAVMGAGALAVLVRICAGRPGAGPEMAALCLTSLLLTPYVLDYDLVVATPALAWMARSGLSTLSRLEAVIASCLYFVPLAARAAGLLAHLTVAPIVLIAALLVIGQRGRSACQ